LVSELERTQTGTIDMAIITISRGSFAGGKRIAEGLAERLGYPCLGREDLLQQAANEYGISEAELVSTLNEAPPFWQQVPGKRLAYVKCVTAVLLEHALQGNLVYHGNVGHLLLADVPGVLRVRVLADPEFRIEAAMKQMNLDREHAIAHIQRVDKERARWARLLYGVDWEDPHLYDVVLNLGHISVSSGCETIARMTELPEYELTPESSGRLEDFQLSCRVWGALARNPATRSSGLQITAHHGAVRITGSVGSAKTSETIAQMAQAVDGVKSLECQVGVGTDWYW
jgi:cytidylate kinase